VKTKYESLLRTNTSMESIYERYTSLGHDWLKSCVVFSQLKSRQILKYT